MYPRSLASRLPLLLAVLASAAVAALLTLAFRASSRQKPVLDLLMTMNSPDPARRQAARAQLISKPDTHAPVLVSVIRRGKTRWHGEILPWLDDIPPIAARRTRQLTLERHAIDVLQRMGPPAAPHVLPLLAETRFGGRDTAIALLRAYGPPVCPFLIQGLNHPQPLIRAGIAATLGRFHSHQLGSLDPLRHATVDASPIVRAAAIEALSQMLDRAPEILPDLILALDDPDPTVQTQAAAALRTFGAQASPAVTALRHCLAASADPVRAEAALTLAAIGGDAARAAGPELLNALRQRDGPSSRQAAATLVHLDLHRDEALARLIRFFEHHDSRVRIRTLEAVRDLGPLGEPLVPSMLRLLENDDDRDNRPALQALRNIQPDAIPEAFRRGRRNPVQSDSPGPRSDPIERR